MNLARIAVHESVSPVFPPERLVDDLIRRSAERLREGDPMVSRVV